MEEVSEQLDPVDEAGARPREGRGGVDGEDPPGAQRLDLGPMRDHLLARPVDVEAAGHRDHYLGGGVTQLPQLASRDFSPALPATSRPPAAAIISGTQWPPT